jgi:predicted GNAT family acetyltransferase
MQCALPTFVLMEIINNKRQSQFELKLPDGEIAVLTYRWLKGSMVLMHTAVPKSGQNKGVGSAIAKYALENARTHNLKIVVYCPFVAAYMKRHPEYNDLIDEEHRK